MKTITPRLLALCFSLSFFSLSAQFDNHNFEIIYDPCHFTPCNPNADAFDCVFGWYNASGSTGTIDFLQSSSCPGDVVCDGEYAIKLKTGSGGSTQVAASTRNPFHNEPQHPYLMSLVANAESSGNRIVVEGVNSPEGLEVGTELSYQIVESVNECGTTQILLPPEVVDYPYLKFSASGEGPNEDIVIDELKDCGQFYNIVYDGCEELLKIKFNEICSYTADVLWQIDIDEVNGDATYSYVGIGAPSEPICFTAPPGAYEIHFFVDAPDGNGHTYAEIFDYQAKYDPEECCELFSDPNFFIGAQETEVGTQISVSNFGVYEDVDAEHYWYIYARAEDGTEDLIPITFTTTQGPGPHIIYTGDPSLKYVVVHRLISLCGEACAAKEALAGGSVQEEGQITDLETNDLSSTALCDMVNEDFPSCNGQVLVAPTGLTSFQTGPFTVLIWDAVPGADTYIVTSTFGDGCVCLNPIPNLSRETAYNFHAFRTNNYSPCFAWTVRAVCGETGAKGPWAEPDCYDINNQALQQINPGTATDPLNKMGVSTYPNPATDQINIRVNLPYDSEVTLELFDAAGKQVQGYRTQIEAKAFTPANTTWATISQLSSGIYYVRYTTQQESFTSTIVVN